MHDDIRTTFALRREVYDRMKASYRQMGFGTMAELVNEAVRDYLHRRRLETMNRAMEEARGNGCVLHAAMRDLRPLDDADLPADY